MSEMVEMMLDGFVCEQCGQVIDFESVGYPRKCEFCEDEYNEE